jgi:hypothetical protein
MRKGTHKAPESRSDGLVFCAGNMSRGHEIGPCAACWGPALFCLVMLACFLAMGRTARPNPQGILPAGPSPCQIPISPSRVYKRTENTYGLTPIGNREFNVFILQIVVKTLRFSSD